MNLAEILAQLDKFSDAESLTIYAKRSWSPTALAFVTQQPDDGKLPEAASSEGFSYFLEVFIAQEILADWSGTFEAFCLRVIQYAEHDA